MLKQCCLRPEKLLMYPEKERRAARWQFWANGGTLAADQSGWREKVRALHALWHREMEDGNEDKEENVD